jgi:hypothetical protein
MIHIDKAKKELFTLRDCVSQFVKALNPNIKVCDSHNFENADNTLKDVYMVVFIESANSLRLLMEYSDTGQLYVKLFVSGTNVPVFKRFYKKHDSSFGILLCQKVLENWRCNARCPE